MLAPLVAVGPPLTPDDVERFSRHLLLAGFGEEAQRRVRNARVCVLGAGGLGSPAISYLVAAGVGTLGVVDDDVVALSNLQRQVLHRTEDVGTPKTRSAARAARALDPSVDVVLHEVRLTEANADEILRDYDVVLDGTDSFDTRYLVSDACARLGLPVVWASVLQMDAQVSVFWADAPDDRGLTLRDLFPEPPAPGTVPSCSQAGVLGAMCGQVGSLMATEAIKLVAGIGDVLLGRVLVIDALRSRWTEVPLLPAAPRLPAAPPLPAARPMPDGVGSEPGVGAGSRHTVGASAGRAANAAPRRAEVVAPGQSTAASGRDGAASGRDGAASGREGAACAASYPGAGPLSAGSAPAATPPVAAGPGGPHPSTAPTSGTTPDAAAPLPDEVTVAELRRRLDALAAGDDDLVVVDVRTAEERAVRTIPGSVHVPLDRLMTVEGRAAVPQDRDVVLFCAVGGRSAHALTILRAAGHTRVAHLPGGMSVWPEA
ncbi:molybdopterin/thiamine biosynthesis adenylyltransferase [Flavimobilis soli]|uniref:Molybdopterin/thiamine biosynthesis adenylyltransferase n=1 Tax=Flavimobilis soli TaxID=442709 RepID=A0A2A9EDY4_9MICO|nr:ThiF family adenylyltransferase [Flavimobilis soli]PFG36771.1 molybdopterin/thiamine biosynthesis adenylyltransferase [Flavimobilis soli]